MTVREPCQKNITEKTMRTLTLLSSLLMFPYFAATAAEDVPASQRDVQNGTRRIERSIQRAAKGIANAQNAARSAEKSEHDGITALIDSVARGQQSLATTIDKNNAASQAAITAATGKTQRTMWLVGLSSVGLLMIGGAVFVLRIRKGRNAETDAQTALLANRIETIRSPTAEFVRIRNPDVPTLQKLRQETGRDRFPVLFEFQEKDGFDKLPPVNCNAVFLPGQSRPVAEFPGETAYVSWGKIKPHIDLISRRTHVA